MRWFLSALFAVTCVMAMAQSQLPPGRIQVEHDITADVPFAIMFQENADGSGGGLSHPYNFSGQGTFENPFDQSVYAGIVTLIGLYEPESGGISGLNIMVSETFGTAAAGQEFSDVFNGTGEGALVDALFTIRNAAPGQNVDEFLDLLSGFFEDNKPAFAGNGENAVFMNFSTGTIVGSGKWVQNAVPEPSALLLLGAAGGLAFLRRRKAA